MIDSILNQHYKKISILVRDDGSSDETINILEDYASKHTFFSYFLGDNVGVINSFKSLISKRDLSCDLFMFCDQDDYWFDSKVSTFVNVYQNSNNFHVPFLCVGDLITTDNNLKVISNSFWKDRGFDVDTFKYQSLFFENYFPGCNMALNGCFLSSADEIPTCYDFLMHDFYFIHIAVSLNCLYFERSPQMYYIQHESNVIGAKKPFLSKTFLTYFSPKYYVNRYREWLEVYRYIFNRYPYNSRLKFLSLFGNNLLPLDYFKLANRSDAIKFYCFYSIGYLVNLFISKLRFTRY